MSIISLDKKNGQIRLERNLNSISLMSTVNRIGFEGGNIVELNNSNTNINLETNNATIKFQSIGGRGLPGEDGQDGADGLSAYEIAVQNGFVGTEAQWLATLTGDLTYSMQFTALSVVSVIHNLGKRPAVTIIDSAGDEVEGEVEHNNINQLTVTFSSSFSGMIFCN